MTNIEREMAQNWDQPDMMIDAIESPRVPFTEPIARIVGAAVEAHLNPGGTILEIGAGSGFLKEVLPVIHRMNLISSDYNPRNLKAGLERRSLTPLVASAYELPIKDAAVDCVIDLDAVDTLPNFDDAFKEIERVLKPGGKYIHFQINCPSDDILEHSQPDMVWFPATKKTDAQKQAVGVSKNELYRIFEDGRLEEPYIRFLKTFVDNPVSRLQVEDAPDSDGMVDMVLGIIEGLGLDQVFIPSLYEYFKDRLTSSATSHGLEVIQGEYKRISVGSNEDITKSLMLGREWRTGRGRSMIVGKQAATSAAMMVFVAQKNA
ncbi:methyltransferase domain-containing protein [Candidatus Saccharibacteria bacterium]|nr:methyltransferase domain-containing protein [Candidatus Saccharibacteria bacterium]